MNRRIGARLERLEHQVGAAPDLTQETKEYGTRVWSVPGFRAYGQDTPDGARLAVVGGPQPLVYEVVGVALGDLR
ncbi:hypothetical protein Sipo8835_00065 [Streptomyces ipomoeae]|uniref:Uncharacterized protein n=1 Tax=Streptomyces ipomoeae TaxID=103232 RepID=A0AAE8WAD1_9ACTN|nr:hypothetical protein [Streptomyces ipomoeae]TQE40241.1 hypothetical protein Sipo8835_00065 [Streptomyces ipomoeae]